MSWFLSKSNKNKLQSIKELKTAFPSLKEVQASNDEYILEISIDSSKLYTLKVYLDNSFPDSKPSIKI